MTTTSSPIGVIDVGSNSIKLLVARACEDQKSLEVLTSPTILTRISQGISGEHPTLTPEAIDAGAQTIAELADTARAHGADPVIVVATSAVRDAHNRDVFIEKVRETSGLTLEVLSGIDEARAIGRGIQLDPLVSQCPEAQVIDLGGGSMEYLRLSSGNPLQVESYQLGSVRLTEMAHRADIRPEDSTFANWIRDQVKQAMQSPPCLLLEGTANIPLFGAGGSLYTIYQYALKTNRVKEPVLPATLLTELLAETQALSVAERAALPGVERGRADILPTALATLAAVCALGNQPQMSLCSFNLRFGIAAEHLGLKPGGTTGVSGPAD